MSARPQAAPTIDYVPRPFEQTSAIVPRPNRAAPVSRPSALLVGRSGSWGSLLLKSLERFGSELSLVAPQDVTAALLKNAGYDFILLDSTVPPEQRRQLASELAGSSVSMFYTFPVENGCWFLPALRAGRDCHGSPAFRRKEFPLELERILRANTGS